MKEKDARRILVIKKDCILHLIDNGCDDYSVIAHPYEKPCEYCYLQENAFDTNSYRTNVRNALDNYNAIAIKRHCWKEITNDIVFKPGMKVKLNTGEIYTLGNAIPNGSECIIDIDSSIGTCISTKMVDEQIQDYLENYIYHLHNVREELQNRKCKCAIIDNRTALDALKIIGCSENEDIYNRILNMCFKYVPEKVQQIRESETYESRQIQLIERKISYPFKLKKYIKYYSEV